MVRLACGTEGRIGPRGVLVGIAGYRQISSVIETLIRLKIQRELESGIICVFALEHCVKIL